ncbi:family 10 glycosylhydrolase [Bacteroidota bacterium]
MRIIIYLLSFFISCQVCGQKNKEIEIRGVYGNPDAFWNKNLILSDLGVNAIFVHSGSINQKMITRARQKGLKVYAEFATLNGKNYVDKHPEAWAINEKGNKVEAAGWFMGVCPTDPGFRQYRMKQLGELLQKFDLDGIWMDYVHWHAQFEEPEPILPETCFCDQCLKTFQKTTLIEIPHGNTNNKANYILKNHEKEWRDWRCSIIADWASEMKSIVKLQKPEALLGIYHCPWKDDEFNGARRKVLGLDYDLLKEIVDVFSPMVYHGRMGRNPEWVKDNIEWFSNRIDGSEKGSPKIWPIVQAYNDPYTISAEEFGQVLENGLTADATGVMMFTTWAVAEDLSKITAMKRVYIEIQDK